MEYSRKTKLLYVQYLMNKKKKKEVKAVGIFSGSAKKKQSKSQTSAGTQAQENLQQAGGTIEKLWEKCPACNEIIYKKDIQRNLNICPKCGYYFGMTCKERIDLLIDAGTFEEHDGKMISSDPLGFPGYKEKAEESSRKTGISDAVMAGNGKINGTLINIAVMDFNFMGGSMGSVVGEKITRAVERAIEMKTPVVVVSTSGGARMHEGILSLMQMAKTSAALDKLRNAGLPFISVPVNPTTGGVTASFAMLGDVNITEPKALIAFAGPRVIEQTIRQKLPEGFQKSEFLLDHGMIDVIAKREELKNNIYRVIKNLGFAGGEK